MEGRIREWHGPRKFLWLTGQDWMDRALIKFKMLPFLELLLLGTPNKGSADSKLNAYLHSGK